MRGYDLCPFLFLSGLVTGLLSPLFAPVPCAEGLVQEPFVCAGAYDQKALASHRLAKLAQGETTQLTALVIFAKFAGEVPWDTLAPDYAGDLFNPDLFGSLSHFYHEMSCGQFEITGSVLPKRYASLHGGGYYVALDEEEDKETFGQFNQEVLAKADDFHKSRPGYEKIVQKDMREWGDEDLTELYLRGLRDQIIREWYLSHSEP